MNVDATDGLGPLGGLGGAGGATGQLDEGAFLELLVSQLKHQDPLQPSNNEEFVAQLATFASLEQLQTLNDGVVTMVLLQQSNALLSQLTEGSALIGQEIAWSDPTTGQSGVGVVESVKVIEGTPYLKVGGKDVALVDVVEVLGSGDDAPADDAGDGEA